MALDRSDSNNITWSRVAGQFAIRQVIREMEGAQYVRSYWNMDNFYVASGQAPSVYLTYARWLATNGIARGRITGKITVSNAKGNLTRIENALNNIPKRLATVEAQLDALVQQQSIAEVEVTKPFPQEEELKTKSARLAELDACLNIDGRPEPAAVMDDQADEIAEKRPPRTLSESLRVPCQPGENKSKKDRTEVR